MNHLTVETEDTFVSLLELAANNDVEGFKRFIDRNPSSIDEIGLWYGRRKGSKQMVNEPRTPLMVAATYGSIEVMRIILSLSNVDVNQFCGLDKSTALHCAASGGAVEAVEAVKLLLAAGADPNLSDANGHRPGEIIVVPPKLQHVRVLLEELLELDNDVSVGEHGLRISTTKLNSNSPENGSPASAPATSPVSSPVKGSEKKEYPIDPSLPDIKNSIFSTDEFRMYSFKVRPCSRAYSHDWTECPFVHPGENARRRDPRKFHYSCVPCPDFRKGACRRGDMCEYAHGVFECWLHPAQYRTRLCKDGIGCARRVCFFAHTEQELRPLYVSTGSAVLSPRSAAVDFMNLIPGSPSSSPSPFTPPMSPSANAMSQVPWGPQNVPTLHLPQSSRLRSSINARDIQDSDFEMLDFDLPPQQTQQILNELCLANSLNRSGRLKPNLTPSNLEELFSSESLSPRYNEHPNPAHVFSPTHKSAMINQFQQHQQQQQTMLSPINTGRAGPMLHSPFGSGRMSPRNIDPISPISARLSMLSQREQFRSLSSRELGSGSNMVGSPVGPWSKWGNSNGKPDWALSSDELRRSNSFNGQEPEPEPDLSWVQTLVKESPTDLKEKLLAGRPGPSEGPSISQTEPVDHAVLGAWLEQMKLDQLVTQQN